MSSYWDPPPLTFGDPTSSFRGGGWYQAIGIHPTHLWRSNDQHLLSGGFQAIGITPHSPLEIEHLLSGGCLAIGIHPHSPLENQHLLSGGCIKPWECEYFIDMILYNLATNYNHVIFKKEDMALTLYSNQSEVACGA